MLGFVKYHIEEPDSEGKYFENMFENSNYFEAKKEDKGQVLKRKMRK